MVRTTLGLDPRMIKFGVVRLGSTLEEVKGVQGGVEWRSGLGEGNVGGRGGGWGGGGGGGGGGGVGGGVVVSRGVVE